MSAPGRPNLSRVLPLMGGALATRRRKGYQGRSPWLVCSGGNLPAINAIAPSFTCYNAFSLMLARTSVRSFTSAIGLLRSGGRAAWPRACSSGCSVDAITKTKSTDQRNPLR
jgi:hypothetical protein